MLTRLKIRNFKRLDEIDIELGEAVVFIGPNNSGKTTALQALALWDIGLKKWKEKRKGSTAKERAGVSINRKDVLSAPVPDASLFWRNLHVRKGSKDRGTQNIRIDVVVEGITNSKEWECGLEFDYDNEESFICRPLREKGYEGKAIKDVKFTNIPEESGNINIAYLPPMSGLSAREFRKERGEINVMIGEGQTAQVLRNMCYHIYEKDSGKTWSALVDYIKELFGVKLSEPQYISERSEIRMTYREGKIDLDLSCSGRGLQQTLLLLTHLYVNPNTVLLLDEPDAHLEVLRQRQIYQLITDLAEKQGSQIIAASHSEIVLTEAANKDIVIAFVGKPHRINDRGSQVLKSLRDIGYDQYYLAEQSGWVLYLEGSTDLSILKSFAETLGHEAAKYLERPFVYYVANQPNKVKEHFWGIMEAKSDLKGIAIFDSDVSIPTDLGAKGLKWKKREIENYLCFENVLLKYAVHDQPDDLFGSAEASRRETVMRETIDEIKKAFLTLKGIDPCASDVKVSDEFLGPLFEKYFKKLGLPNLLRKSGYHILAKLVSKDQIDREIAEKLDAIVNVAKSVKNH